MADTEAPTTTDHTPTEQAWQNGWNGRRCAQEWGLERVNSWWDYVSRGRAPQPLDLPNRERRWNPDEVTSWPRRGTGWRGRRNLPADMVTTAEAAKLLGLGRQTVYRYLYSGKLPAEQIDGDYAIKRADVDALAAARKPAAKESGEEGQP